jgi:hypothetical protein
MYGATDRGADPNLTKQASTSVYTNDIPKLHKFGGATPTGWIHHVFQAIITFGEKLLATSTVFSKTVG